MKEKETVIKFCEMMLEKYPDVQSIKIAVELKNKTKFKFKKHYEK